MLAQAISSGPSVSLPASPKGDLLEPVEPLVLRASASLDEDWDEDWVEIEDEEWEDDEEKEEFWDEDEEWEDEDEWDEEKEDWEEEWEEETN
jgi:hypothetical protein